MPNIKQLRGMASDLRMKAYRRLSKPELIRAIQRAEGHSPCFESIPDCGQMDCLFYADCVGPLAVGQS